MAEDGQNNGDLRHRRSTHREDGSDLASVDSNAPAADSTIIPNAPGAGEGTPIEGRATHARTTSTDTATTVSKNVAISSPKVRFSEDVERRPSATSIASDGKPEGKPDVKITTATSPVLGGNIVTSPTSLRSISPVLSESGPSSLPFRMTSRTRDRGYSLRRTLFNRSIRGESGEGVVIELETSNTSDLQDTQGGGPPGEEKEKRRSDVVVTPTLPEEDKSQNMKDLLALPLYQKRRPWWVRQLERSGLGDKFSNGYHHVRKIILKAQDIPPTANGRQIDVDPSHVTTLIDERTGRPYIANVVRSTRYTPLNFFPRQLFAQFSKLANFYFLCVSILQMIPGLSTTGTYTTIVPLLFFVGISMAKEGYDDSRRARLDKEENNRDASVLESDLGSVASGELPVGESRCVAEESLWARRKWRDLKVGDIVKLERDQPAPADLALIYAKDPNHIAFVETMALDGETNLKSKQVPRLLVPRCETVQAIASLRAKLVVEDPNIDLYNFEGKVTINEETLPLTNNEIIYRGSVLRNTPYAVGVIIYSGEECKIRMNANKTPRIKAPALQSVVNQVVVLIVIFVLILALFCTVAYQIWAARTEKKSWYLDKAHVAFGQVLVSYIIMFNTMIPLSLYVSLEIVKVCQMLLLNDIDMYDEDSNTPIEPRTSTINEELGQVSHLFSDKTGTLTNNSMKFRKISVAGTAWLHDKDLQEEAGREGDRQLLVHKKRSAKGKKAMSRKSNVSAMAGPTRKSAGSSFVLRGSHDANATFALAGPQKPRGDRSLETHGGHTEEMIEYIMNRPQTLFARKARFLLLAMAICHTCTPEKDSEGDVKYQGASPDEVALVSAAKDMGYLVVDRQAHTVTVKTNTNGSNDESRSETYEILNVIEFSSARKRMSIIVRMPDRRICMFCKGADTTLMRLLKLKDLASSKALEIERRASQRKSMEITEFMRRRSDAVNRKGSVARTSLSLGRTSIGVLPTGRASSISAGRRATMLDSVDHWLRERETDVDTIHSRDSSQYYTPRPSAHFGSPLPSRTSFTRFENDTENGEELVEEALVLNDALVFERCFQHINDFATEGLRTLLYGHRFITEDEYKGWQRTYHEATTSLTDRQIKIEKAADQIETNLDLTGATAIEDRLQKGVPEAIEKLRRANIKLWMLTGDKRETAINIGHSCRLIKDYSDIIVLDHELGSVDEKITSSIIALRSSTVAHSVLVVDGATLSLIESEPAVFELFINLAVLANSVICCRASPSQKALLVKTIRHRIKGSVTLAIGDGANDIAMIQEAHVGIGITGKEGLQAGRCSDYSIAQFRFLLKLLLVHGRWNYNRVSKYTLGTFWKEMMFYLTQALYQRYAGYTGTSLYESWSLSMFNTLFTSLPVIFMGVFAKDLASSTLLAVPELYSTLGPINAGFNVRVYLFWTFMSSAEAVIIFFTMYGLFALTPLPSSINTDPYAMGTLTFTACIILIALKMQALEFHNKSITSVIAIVVSIGGWFLWCILLSVTYHSNTEYVVKSALLSSFGRTLLWWLVLFLTVSTTLLFEITISTLRATFIPTDVDVFQALEKDIDIKKRFEEASAEELRVGWDRGTKKSSFEILREQEAERERERQVEELLARRQEMDDEDNGEGRKENSHAEQQGPTGLMKRRRSEPLNEHSDSSQTARKGSSTTGSVVGRKSLEVAELFSKGFGSIKK